MTAEGFGPTVPTGRYPVVDHDFGTCPPFSDSPPSLSADCRKCRLGLKYAGVFKASAVRIPSGKYPRLVAGFRGPGGRCAGSVPAGLPHRRPAATPDASPEPARRPGDCKPPLVTAAGAAAKAGPQLGKASLRILFLSAGQNCPRTLVSLPRRVGGQYWGVACNPIWDTMAVADGR